MLRILTRTAVTSSVGLGIALWAVSAEAVPTAAASRADVNAAIGDATTTAEMFDHDLPDARLIILDLGATTKVGDDDRGSLFADKAMASQSDVDGVDEDDTAAPTTLTDVFPLPVIGILLAGLGLLAARRRSRARRRVRASTPPPS